MASRRSSSRACRSCTSDVVERGLLTTTGEPREAVAATEVSLICVGTPSTGNGSLDTSALERVAWEIGSFLPDSKTRHTVVVRSTVLPGTTEELVKPALEKASALRAGDDFGLAMNPEFLREGSSVSDFDAPPKTVIGELDGESGDAVAGLYGEATGPAFRVPIRVAEMVKYVDNAFHALKVGFGNEIGAASRAFGIDSHARDGDLLCGHEAQHLVGVPQARICLRRFLPAKGLARARSRNATSRPRPSDSRTHPRVEPGSSAANRGHLLRLGRRRIGLFGLAFKSGTDDLRESPLVELAEQLLGKGFDLQIFDPAVSLSELVGTNREFIDERIPHLSARLAADAEAVLKHAEVCIIGSTAPETIEALAHANGRSIVDLVRLPDADRPPRRRRIHRCCLVEHSSSPKICPFHSTAASGNRRERSRRRGSR